MSSTPLRCYLDNYGEPLVGLFEASIRRELRRTYQSVLVVPVYDEPPDCIDRVLPKDVRDTLVIVVVNAPAEDGDSAALLRTQAFLNGLGARKAPLTVVFRDADTALLVVDCCSMGRRLPNKQGVGGARKIGADLALSCIESHVVATPWIHCTDADATLPVGYFDDGGLCEEVAVAIYPFIHHPLNKNILLYEISLRYYVTQLARAGSPYAFHTIGSLLKINAKHYAAVRGFPKRQAAEDFYLLNKLAKTGKVVRLISPQISLSSRISTRVPFGTGATMQRLAATNDFVFYHPEVFNRLRAWLGIIELLWRDRDVLAGGGIAQWWDRMGLEDDILLTTLLQLGLEKTLQHAYRQCRDYLHFKFFIWVWFDAFRTLKFVHHLRDRYFPSLPLEDTIELIPRSFDSCWSAEFSATLTTLQCIDEMLIWEENQLPSQIGPTMCFKSKNHH